MLTDIKNYLKELGFSSNEIKIYIALTQLGEAKASKIAKQADLPRTTTISLLNKLCDSNFITTHKYKGITYYWIESPKTITNIFSHKTEISEQLNMLLGDLYRSEAHFPLAEIFDTKTNIKKFIEKTLTNLEKNSVIYTIDAPKEGNYAKIYTESAEDTFAKLKKKKEIITNTLIPFGSFKNIAEYKIKNQNIKIKEMPENINFEASIWIINDLLIHFSGKPPFIVSIKHSAIVSGMKSIFDFLWQISKSKN